MKLLKINFVIVALMGMLVAGCNQSDEQFEHGAAPEAAAPVTVHVDGFSVSQEEFSATRTTTPIANYDGVTVVTLAFYDGGTEVYKSTQLKNDPTTFTTFGNFSLSLPVGSYTMVVLGYVLYDNDELTLTSPTQAEYTGGCPRETFSATQAVNITSTSAVNLSATLNRIIACLQVISTDGKVADVSKVRMSFAAGGKRFSPTSGLATLNTGSVSTVNNSAAVGTTSTSTAYVFLANDTQTMDVTIETLDGEGHTVYSTVVESVPFKRNRKTKLTGSIYPTAAATSGVFSVEAGWLSDYNANF